MVILDLYERSIHTILSIPVFIKALGKVYHKGELKKDDLSYTTRTASLDDLTGDKGPLLL